MKKLLLVLVLSISVFNLTAQEDSGFGNEYIFASSNFIELDHQYHFMAGAGFAFVGYLGGLRYYDGDRSKAIWAGITIGLSANIVKEVTDINKTGFNTTDIVWGLAGAALSTYITDKIHYPNWKARQKAEIAEMEKERISLLTEDEKLLEKM
jgi:hypothetical protein